MTPKGIRTHRLRIAGFLRQNIFRYIFEDMKGMNRETEVITEFVKTVLVGTPLPTYYY